MVRKAIDWNSIDRSGIVYSDLPRIDNGWIKGWVSGKKHITVCAHSNPAPGHKVHVWADGQKVERTITAVNRPVIRIKPNSYASVSDFYLGGDIAVCTLNEEWPANVKVYIPAKATVNGQKAATFHQDKTFSLRTLRVGTDVAWIESNKGRPFEPGDSGSPWFVWEQGSFRVASHLTWGSGAGPNYSVPRVRKIITAGK